MEVITKTEVTEAAREFGEALAGCEECRAVEEAQESLRQNEEATKLVADYQLAQRSLRMARMWGRGVSKEEMDRLKDLGAKINSNQIIKNLSDAQKGLQEMLGNLNTEISDLLGIDFASNSRISGSGCC